MLLFFFPSLLSNTYLTSSITWASMKMLGDEMDSLKGQRQVLGAVCEAMVAFRTGSYAGRIPGVLQALMCSFFSVWIGSQNTWLRVSDLPFITRQSHFLNLQCLFCQVGMRNY